MVVLDIVLAPDPILNMRSKEVTEINADIRQLVNDMTDTMNHHDGLGIAAVQIGVHKRIFLANIPEDFLNRDLPHSEGYTGVGGIYVIINPEIIETSEEHIELSEGCLSLPEQNETVNRPRCITMKYMDINGENQILHAENWLARCCLHELEHLDGKIFINNFKGLKHSMLLKKANKVKRMYKKQ